MADYLNSRRQISVSRLTRKAGNWTAGRGRRKAHEYGGKCIGGVHGRPQWWQAFCAAMTLSLSDRSGRSVHSARDPERHTSIGGSRC